MDWNERSLAQRLEGKHVFFATPCYGAQVFLNWHVSMMETLLLLKDIGVSFTHPPTGGDSLVQRARNVLVANFLQSPATHLMFIDADIGFRGSDIVKMLAGDVDIVGGVYPKKCYPLEWPANIFWQDREPEFHPETKWIAAKDLPTGFLLISRKCIETMVDRHPEWKCIFDPAHAEEPYSYSLFDCYTDTDGVYLSEDFAFCRRAQAEGFKTWCDPTIALTHFGGHQFGGACIADTIFPQAEEEIEGWMSADELRWLKTAAARMTSACEIGCWKGRSTHALLSKVNGPVYAVDHWLGSAEEGPAHEEAQSGDVFEQFKANVGHFDNLKIVRGHSHDVAGHVPEVDMVFIDGSHEYEAVKKDIELYAPKAKTLICGHDYNWPGVARAVREKFGPRVSRAQGTIWQVWV